MIAVPTHLLLQWHVTERCNLRCTHCYQENYGSDELSFDKLLGILAQFKELLAILGKRAGKKLRAHITVTGGEPFARRDFWELLEVFAAHRRLFSFAILTNGTLIDKAMAKHLASLKPVFVQISIEGTPITHDSIRGQGNFAKTVTALQQLRREKIRTLISFTAHRTNFREFPSVAKLGQQLKVAWVWSDRLIPYGSGIQLQQDVLTPSETKEFFMLMEQTRHQLARAWFKRTEVKMHRALQFLVTGKYPYHCSAGDSLITVQPNGDLYPCRRLPIRVGNLLETPLVDLYDHSKLFHALRNPQRMSEGCQSCFYATLCRGGLKCLAYAVTGDPFKADPGCWLADTTIK